MSAEALAAFGELVAADRDLHRRLLATVERDQFVALVVQLAQAAGFEVRPDDVEEGLRARRRAWLERWI